MLNDQLNVGLDVVELVKMSQRAENVFVGMNCGIMDQFAVGMGKKEHAIALDCGTLDYDLIPLNLNGYKLVITNSNKNHDLVTSEYNVRRSQCEQALVDINQELNVKHLCDLREEELERVRDLISDETVYRRARHAVSENARVNEAIGSFRGIDECVASLIEGRLRGYWCRDGYAGGGRAEVAGRAGVSDHGGRFRWLHREPCERRQRAGIYREVGSRVS